MNHFIKRLSLIIGSVMLVFFSFTACDDEGTVSGPNPDLDIVERMQESGNFSTLLSIATDLGLVETLRNNNLTVIAPTDAAFEALPDGMMDDLTDEQLSEIISYHILSGNVVSSEIGATQDAVTNQGESLYFRNTGSSIIVNGTASFASADLPVSNGALHAVNKVLLPDSYGTVVDNAVKRFSLSSLVGLLEDRGLVSTLADTDSEFTVFAPTNTAIAAIRSTLAVFTDEQVSNTLLYHVLNSAVQSSELSASQSVATLNDGEEILIEVSEGVVTINGSATVQVADVNSTNGVIHIIDEVLIPEALRDIRPPDDANPLVGEWSVDPTPGSLAVGPSPDNLTWYSISSGEIATRGCFYDDLYIFNSDGTYEMDMQNETWVEAWQEGVDADGCAAPVPPHDASTVGSWEVDGSSVTITGEGLFLGLAKVHNGGEDGNPDNDTITYQYSLSEDESMLEITIKGWLADVPDATWYFRFVRQ